MFMRSADLEAKHKAQALYHPAADAFASFLADIPVKLLSTTIFDIVLYFMTGLSRTGASIYNRGLTSSGAILHILSLYLHGPFGYAFHLSYYCGFDKDRGASVVDRWYHGSGNCQLCRLLHSKDVHETLV